MRDIISKVTTASMIAGAALLVTACGETATNNTAANTMGGEYNTSDTMGNMGDMGNMGTTMDSNTMGNTSMDTNTSATTNMTTNTTNTTTNGM